MRTGITQKVPTGNPLVQVVVSGDTHTSEGGGGNDRLMKVTTDEQPWGSQYVVELDNADETLNAKDYEGYPITFNTKYIGETADNFPPLWVWSQQAISKEGKLLLQLNCVDIWTFIAAHNVTLTNASYNQEWQQEAELSTRVMADGVTLLSAGAPALYATLLANGNKTIWAIIQDLATALGISVSLDDTDSYIDTLKPPISISNARSALWQLMDLTKSYLKWKTNGVLGVYQPDAHATVYTFNHLNTFYQEVDEASVTVPNRVYFWAYDSATAPPGAGWISGVAFDQDSHDRIGQWVDRHYLVASMDTMNMRTQAELNTYATGALDKIKAELNQGYLVAPMHCTLELFDKIAVVDDRYGTPRTVTGYVHRMVREYDRGVYRITVYLGGVSGGYTVPGGTGGKGMADGEPPVAPTAGGLTIGAYIADVDFTSVDWDTVSWADGLVTLANGRSQSVLAGSYNFSVDGAHYFYVILGNTTMQVSTTATDAVGEDRMLVAVASRGSTTAQKAYVLNPFTDSILINTDKVMDGLVTELKLAAEAVTNAKVAVGAIYGDCIATSAITETKISSGAITTPKINTGAITTAKLDALAVTASKVAASAITAEKIAANAITANKIHAGAITTVKLDAYAVDATKIATDAVIADKIRAGAVTAEKIDVVTLSAITADCGTLTAGTINGVTIYAGGGNIKIDSSGIDVVGAKLTLEDSNGGHAANMYVDTNGRLRLDASVWYGGVMAYSLATTYGIDASTHIKAGTFIRATTNLYAGEATSPPTGTFGDGAIRFNPNTGYLNVYYSGTGWYHLNRDSGWA